MKHATRLLPILAVAAAFSASALAQTPAAPPAAERLRKVFAERLRLELQLTDAQTAEVVPKIEAIQRVRTEERREKMLAARELRAALRDGASDETIGKLLARLDAAEVRRDSEIRSRMKEVDAALSMRQRAELRFFVARFRGEVERRIRGDGGGGRRGQGMPPRRPLPPPAEQP